MLCRQAVCPAATARLLFAFCALFLSGLALSGCGGGASNPAGSAVALSAPAAGEPACEESCDVSAFWDAIGQHAYLESSASPHQSAFAAFGLAQGSVDRSGNSYLLDGGEHGRDISDFLTRIGLPDSHYTYLQVRDYGSEQFSVPEITANYLTLSSSDFVNFSFGFVYAAEGDSRSFRIKPSQIKDGAWIIHSTGNGSSQDPFASLSAADREGALAAAETGKIHFYYGLNGQLAGRDAKSNGCRNIQGHCIGAPYEFTVQTRTQKVISLRGTSYSAPFGFAAYLMAWERMPPETDIGAVFALALECVDDLGAPGADADTGLGRLDIGCMAHGARRAQDGDAAASMDEAAQDLFGARLGELSLPGATDAGLQVGFAGDSFSGTYRLMPAAAGYRPGVPALAYAALAPAAGIVGDADGRRLGAYLQVGERLKAAISLARGEDFFGGRGSGEFAFSCSNYASLSLAGEVGLAGAGDLSVQGWLQEGRAGCVSGSLLDRLQGREAGISLAYRGRLKGARVEARIWGARFLGGQLQVAGDRFAVSGSDAAYGGRLQISYSF